jgi:hypothetical protein
VDFGHPYIYFIIIYKKKNYLLAYFWKESVLLEKDKVYLPKYKKEKVFSPFSFSFSLFFPFFFYVYNKRIYSHILLIGIFNFYF